MGICRTDSADALRTFFANRAGNDFDLLAVLGTDLPGAVRAGRMAALL